jgi:hypothetical protein
MMLPFVNFVQFLQSMLGVSHNTDCAKLAFNAATRRRWPATEMNTLYLGTAEIELPKGSFLYIGDEPPAHLKARTRAEHGAAAR